MTSLLFSPHRASDVETGNMGSRYGIGEAGFGD